MNRIAFFVAALALASPALAQGSQISACGSMCMNAAIFSANECYPDLFTSCLELQACPDDPTSALAAFQSKCSSGGSSGSLTGGNTSGNTNGGLNNGGSSSSGDSTLDGGANTFNGNFGNMDNGLNNNGNTDPTGVNNRAPTVTINSLGTDWVDEDVDAINRNVNSAAATPAATGVARAPTATTSPNPFAGYDSSSPSLFATSIVGLVVTIANLLF